MVSLKISFEIKIYLETSKLNFPFVVFICELIMLIFGISLVYTFGNSLSDEW